jgi:hypothetical protein
MATKKPVPLFQVGDRVKIRYSDWRGRVVEFRGPLAPGGVFVYRVRVPDKPKPIYIELPEHFLLAIPSPPKSPPLGSQVPEAPVHEGNGPPLSEASKNPTPLFQVGDRAVIRYSDWRVRIVELLGPLAPGGMPVYRVRVRIPHESKPIRIELREDQLVALPTPAKKKPNPSARRRVRDKGKGR